MTVHQLVQRPTVQGTLALDLGARLPAAPAPAALSPAPRRRQLADVIPIEPLVRHQLEVWVQRYAQAVVEIVGGDRPAGQVVSWTSQEVLTDLQRRALLVARAGAGARREPTVRPHVASVHSCFVSPSVAEAGVRVRYGARSRALALRFERHRELWVCVALELA